MWTSHQGTVDINVNGKHSQLEYDPEVFEASLETINLTDVRLSNVRAIRFTGLH